MKVGVPDVDVIPPFRKIKFTNKLGQVTFYHLNEIDFDVTTDELEYTESDPDDNNSDQSKSLLSYSHPHNKQDKACR
jgi:hypothetical protein